ncbi:SDR family NAD(P)-dependent oxidoreductase [Streptococcus infantarius subsp. infantarius]|uniref:SDR family NAD(P)-dependent oxidoreductase n=1 Tax=Streptococcus infantarius TaxID=102684 RepID=UPI001BDAE057|nr:SDR family NAD(P)-dependent oxidoreductase [Streptococcus infantarius]MBT0904030.1 SDR family NAD(P)-dependent oxidoreductase [Streptococcus infantarius subsp. infantarius]MBT0917943.1 SDR family NAD(P)-dependent oxidoreductase [Streptococcus infantarius subsp. infantarius]
MKKAVVIGGSNGIGLAITNRLIEKGYFVYILDIKTPNENDICDRNSYKYYFIDLLSLDVFDLEKFKSDKDVEVLMLTAGFGRVAPFEALSITEIHNMMQVNAISTIQILKYFYDRINCDKDFYTGVMVSIAGIVSSPLFSVYAASKAALNRMIESVNIELEEAGRSNRILNVSPGSIEGTAFNGGKTDLSLTRKLAEEIVNHFMDKDDLFIPEYDKIFHSVIDRYKKDEHQFGVESYQYKVASGRLNTDNRKMKVGYLSGTFDLFHMGHLNLLKRAKEQCDYLIVGVHPNATHKGKKTYISFEERLEIVQSIKYVDKAIESLPEDNEVWNIYHYDKLFVGSDYKGTDRFKAYEKYFEDKGVEIVYFPYTKGTSSTQLRQLIADENKRM